MTTDDMIRNVLGRGCMCWLARESGSDPPLRAVNSKWSWNAMDDPVKLALSMVEQANDDQAARQKQNY